MSFKGASQEVRGRLVRAIIHFLNNNDKKGNRNYNIVRPEGARRFPTTITSPGTPESYTGFAAMLEGTYGIHLDQHGLPCPTSNTDSPNGHHHPSKLSFWRELIKLNAFHHGTIDEEMASSFLPPELQGNLNAPKALKFRNNLIYHKHALRRRLTTCTMFPLVLFWCRSQKFVDGPFSTQKERMLFWAARIGDDFSVLWWWLQPLTSVLNLQWLFQASEPTTPKLIELKVKLQTYCLARMTQTADLVYLHLVDHDPEAGYGFIKNSQAVTKGLQKIKFLLTDNTVPIPEWPTFPSIKIKRTRAEKVMNDESGADGASPASDADEGGGSAAAGSASDAFIGAASAPFSA